MKMTITTIMMEIMETMEMMMAMEMDMTLDMENPMLMMT